MEFEFAHPMQTARSMVVDLLWELPEDTIVMKPLDGKPPRTSRDMANEVAIGTDLGNQFATDLFRIARDLLIRQSIKG